MRSSNQVLLIGYIGQHLSAHTTPTGHRRVSMRVATNEMRETPDGTRKSFTTWHDVVAWNRRADYVQSCLVKGSRVLIRGAIVYRKFEDRTGHTRYLTEIDAQEVINLDR